MLFVVCLLSVHTSCGCWCCCHLNAAMRTQRSCAQGSCARRARRSASTSPLAHEQQQQQRHSPSRSTTTQVTAHTLQHYCCHYPSSSSTHTSHLIVQSPRQIAVMTSPVDHFSFTDFLCCLFILGSVLLFSLHISCLYHLQVVVTILM